MRQAIERVFKSMKESRRLERHCVRGLRQVMLHILMSTLAFQVTALAHIRAGEAAVDGSEGGVSGEETSRPNPVQNRESVRHPSNVVKRAPALNCRLDTTKIILCRRGVLPSYCCIPCQVRLSAKWKEVEKWGLYLAVQPNL